MSKEARIHDEGAPGGPWLDLRNFPTFQRLLDEMRPTGQCRTAQAWLRQARENLGAFPPESDEGKVLAGFEVAAKALEEVRTLARRRQLGALGLKKAKSDGFMQR